MSQVLYFGLAMNHHYFESKEFQNRLSETFHEDAFHYYEWENVYKTHAREELMAELAKQEENHYSWKNGSVIERNRFAALMNEIQERKQTPFYMRLSQSVKTGMIASLVAVFDRFS
jgi:hypothetical protein